MNQRPNQPQNRPAGRPDAGLQRPAGGGAEAPPAPPDAGRPRPPAHGLRILLYVLVLGVLAASYVYRFLPPRLDALFDYFLYMSLATTVTPLPTPPVIILAATREPALLVALVGAMGTVVAYLLEYIVLRHLLAIEQVGRVRQTRVYRWICRLFRRAPFAALTVAAFLPIPVDGVRLMAIAEGYHRGRYALGAFLGRVPRYLLIAVLGRSIDWAVLYDTVRHGPAGGTVRVLGIELGWSSLLLLGGGALLLALAGAGLMRRRRRGRAAAVLALALAMAGASAGAGGARAARDGERGVADTTGTAAPAALAARLERFDRAAAALTVVHATFRQQRYSPVFEDTEQAAGDLWYRAPGELVLRYREPEHQEVYIDTAGVWVFLVAQQQAQRYPFAEPAERDASLAVLWRPSAELARRYRIEPAAQPPAGEEAGGTWLRLTPREADLAQVVERLYLRLDPVNGLSNCLLMERAGGERVRLEILELDDAPQIDDARFRFVPPPGVDVVEF